MRKCVFKTFLFIVILFMCLCCVSTVIEIHSYNNRNVYISGKTVFIDPGHGGKDDGASYEGVLEDYINLKISGYLLELLISLGANVLISRTGDYDLSSMYAKNKKREDLKNRVDYINFSKPDLFVSIHLNTYNSVDVEGGQVFCQGNDRSKKLANFIQNELNILTSKNKRDKLGDYYILNNSLYPGVLIECGFLSNPKERKKLSTDFYQKKLANAIKKGIVDFFVNS